MTSLLLPDFFAVFFEEHSQGFADDLAFAAVQSSLDHAVHSVQVQPAEPNGQGLLHLSRHDFSPILDAGPATIMVMRNESKTY